MNTGWSKLLFIAAATIYNTPAFSLAASSAAALADLEKSIAAEGSAAFKQFSLVYVRGSLTDVYSIEVAQPNLMHMIRTTQGHTLEMYTDARRLYWKWNTGDWNRSPIGGPQANRQPVSPIKLWIAGMSNASEHASIKIKGVTARVFEANVDWQNSGKNNTGKISFLIEASTLKPLHIDFTGMCSQQSCSFHESFTYDKSVSIKPPTD
jgi:hypothetical protein